MSGEDALARGQFLTDIVSNVRYYEHKVELADREAIGQRENLRNARRHLSEAVLVFDLMHTLAAVVSGSSARARSGVSEDPRGGDDA